MRYSGIDIPVTDERLLLMDYEYVDKFTLHSTKGDIEAFKAMELGSIKYLGSIEGGLEVFKHTDEGKRNQAVMMHKLILIPESHPMFNAYIINKIGEKVLKNWKGHQPDMSYNEMNRAIKQSVFKNLKL